MIYEGVDRRDLVLADACKELQISTSVTVQAGFIRDPFPWKRTGLAKGCVWGRERWWMKGPGLGQSRQRKVRA